MPNKISFILLAIFTLGLFTSSAAANPLTGDPKRGEALYNGRCFACHSPDANRVGPMHRGVFGRKAGSLPDYKLYSEGLKNSGITWDEVTLNKWLSGPSDFIPGAKMAFKVNDPQDRADIIAHLKTLTK